MDTSVRCSLRRPVAYSTQGDRRDAQFIELREPSGMHVGDVALLRQSMVKAIRAYQMLREESASDEPVQQDATEESGISADAVISILAAAPVNLGEVYAAARSLFLSKDIAYVDGEEPLKALVLDRLSARDFETMVGTYIATFILSS